MNAYLATAHHKAVNGLNTHSTGSSTITPNVVFRANRTTVRPVENHNCSQIAHQCELHFLQITFSLNLTPTRSSPSPLTGEQHSTSRAPAIGQAHFRHPSKSEFPFVVVIATLLLSSQSVPLRGELCTKTRRSPLFQRNFRHRRSER